MRKLATFIAIGSLLATVEEFLTVVMLKHDVASYIFTLLVLFPGFLAFVFFSSKLINWLTGNGAVRELAHFVIYGSLGLSFEWFLMGLAPWSNPAANHFLMMLFQLGMFSFWATVAFVPRLYLDAGEPSRRTVRSIFRFYVPYFLVVYAVAFSVPEAMRFAAVIPLIVLGYLFLNVFYVKYFLASFSHPNRSAEA